MSGSDVRADVIKPPHYFVGTPGADAATEDLLREAEWVEEQAKCD